MKIEDLKFGDIVTTRNGNKWLFIDSDYVCKETGRHISSVCFEDNLKNVSERDLDIMKVERYNFCYVATDCRELYQLDTIYERKEEILDEEEKEYLRAVIRPFRDRVKRIEKYDWNMMEQITITMCDGDFMVFPAFKKGTMYKGMEVYKEYSIEELEL